MQFRILKTIATSGFLTAPECTKFAFGRGSASDHIGGAYSAPPYSLAGLRGLLLRAGEGRERVGEGKKRVGEWKGKEGEGKGEEGK